MYAYVYTCGSPLVPLTFCGESFMSIKVRGYYGGGAMGFKEGNNLSHLIEVLSGKKIFPIFSQIFF